ncbi:MAG: sulfurtransferase [Desulfobulbaceae bacterium]|nr:MAG: sulfurtransferase [Desulfobulbaceae bacterium]
MNWKNLFSPGQALPPDKAKEYIRAHKNDSFQLLDVRQPQEYEREHLPGAILIPLKELVNRHAELDPDKPTLVYCASGVRSKAASQLLQGQGFKEVYNITGGIKAWNGTRAGGGEEVGMEFFTADEYSDIFKMAYAMEEGLKQLYLGMIDLVDGEREKELLRTMAAFEDRHKAGLLHGFLPEGDEIPDISDLEVMEGGMDRRRIMEHFGPHLHDMEDILNLGMMLEAQAYDLYSRLSRQEQEPRHAKLFKHLADEEKIHLNYLARKLEQLRGQA